MGEIDELPRPHIRCEAAKTTMKLRETFADDDAVSPVIGVILMVAITVILAAVIGTFVLSLGSDLQNNPPNAQFTFSQEDNGDLTMTHDAGDSVDVEKMSVTYDGSGSLGCQTNGGASNEWSGGDAELTAGDSCTLDNGKLTDGDTIRITWESDDGGTSATLAGPYEY